MYKIYVGKLILEIIYKCNDSFLQVHTNQHKIIKIKHVNYNHDNN